MNADTTKDMDTAKASPHSVYETPRAVLEDTGLNARQKLEILRSWELDARELQVAESENMAGGEANLLDEVRQAIDSLEGSDDKVAEQAGKQGARV